MLDKFFSILWDGYIGYYRWLLQFDEIWTVVIGCILMILVVVILNHDANKYEDEMGEDAGALVVFFPAIVLLGAFFFILNVQWDGYCSFEKAGGLGITGWIGFVLVAGMFIVLTLSYQPIFKLGVWTIVRYVFIVMAMAVAVPMVIKFAFVLFILVAFLRSILSILLPWLFK